MVPDRSALISALASRLAPSEVEAYARFAVRTRSPLAREVLQAAGHTAMSGRVAALDGTDDAHPRGLAILDEAVAAGGVQALPGEALSVWAGLLLRAGRDEQLRDLLQIPDLPLSEADRWMLRTDLANPYRTAPSGLTGDPTVVTEVDGAAEARWLEIFNEVHAADGLEPIHLVPAADGHSPYQRLRADAHEPVDGDLVTVVMSAFNPDEDLHAAVRGVLDQTWRNLELLIVDDASGPAAAEVLEEVEALDPRVRVVRAPRNSGTYEARNLALSVAQGRWMTFQDSDDWTHPRRVEHQVRHLLETPSVLANRTWTLRAYPDLTMTFVGYGAERLNASSLLFDRLAVTRIVGGFDATRKSGDMELPFRLRAVRPGSVKDLRHPSPMAITQLRAGSLSRNDALPGWTRWDRLAYRDSYLEWHRQLASGRLDPVLPGDRRPFPLPRPSWHPDREHRGTPIAWEVVVLGDLRPDGRDSLRALGAARTAAHAGLRTAVAHAEAPVPLATKRPDLLPALSTDVRLGRLGLTDAHEEDAVDLLVITRPESLLHIDRAGLRVGRVLVVTDEADPRGWSVAAVDERCQELFGSQPVWGGPASVHDAGSAVRAAVPPQRWSTTDLATVVGSGWLTVGAAASRDRVDRADWERPVVIGHHLEDSPRRWPSPATTIRTAYPSSIEPAGSGDRPTPVEVHCLHSLASAVKALGRRLPPPSWLSFVGTGMTTREFLSHIDVWVYFGVWDEAAEAAVLEALGAGLPCVVGADAPSDLTGPIRSVDPEQAGEAIRDLLATSRSARPTTPTTATTREAEWTRVLLALLHGGGPPAATTPPSDLSALSSEPH